MDLYELVRGPLAWLALVVFLLGSLYRVGALLLSPAGHLRSRRPSPPGSRLCSIASWIVPFGSHTMRKNRTLTLVSFLFHTCIVLLPVFLLAHNVLWYESWQLQVRSLPEQVADILSVFVIAACLFFFVRRLVVSEVKAVSRMSDFVLLFVVALPFATGFLACHGWGPYRAMLILHVLSGEVLLVAIPFTRLRHMLTFAFGRADVGVEYGEVVKSRQW